MNEIIALSERTLLIFTLVTACMHEYKNRNVDARNINWEGFCISVNHASPWPTKKQKNLCTSFESISYWTNGRFWNKNSKFLAEKKQLPICWDNKCSHLQC